MMQKLLGGVLLCIGVVALLAQDPERERPVNPPARPGYDEEMNPVKRLDVLRNASPKPPGSESATSYTPNVSYKVREQGGPKHVSFTSLMVPKEAARYYEKARKELDKARANQLQGVEQLERAVEVYERFAEAWYQLGEARQLLGHSDRAREAFERAILADPGFTDPYMALAYMELKGHRLKEASRFAERALERNPYLAEARLTRAVALYNLGKAETAKEILRDLLDSGELALRPRVHEVLGEVLASERDFRGAATEYRQFLKLEPSSPIAQRVRAELGSWKAAGLIE